VFTVGQKSAFTVGKIWCSRLAKFGVHSWQKYAVTEAASIIYGFNKKTDCYH